MVTTDQVLTPKEKTIKKTLDFGSVIAALLSIPAVVLQSSENHRVTEVGFWSGIVIWIFFVAEVGIFLWIYDDYLKWMRGHIFEIFIIIAASPVLILASERQSFFGLTPVLIIFRFLKLMKLAKLSKIGKLFKSWKILNNNKKTPSWIKNFVVLMAIIITIGLLGMMLDENAHSLKHGYEHWIKMFQEDFHLKPSLLLISVGTLLVALVSLLSARSFSEKRNHE